jgi:hypothetical protein
MNFTQEEVEQLQSMMEDANADIGKLLDQNRHLKNRNAKLVEANTELLSALKEVYDRLKVIHRSAYCEVDDDGTLEETNKIIEKHQSIEQK